MADTKPTKKESSNGHYIRGQRPFDPAEHGKTAVGRSEKVVQISAHLNETCDPGEANGKDATMTLKIDLPATRPIYIQN